MPNRHKLSIKAVAAAELRQHLYRAIDEARGKGLVEVAKELDRLGNIVTWAVAHVEEHDDDLTIEITLKPGEAT